MLGAFDQALHAAIDIGIARAALEDGAEFVRTTSRGRGWRPDVDSAADEEPHVVRRFGELTARLYALEALLARGAGAGRRGVGRTGADPGGRGRGTLTSPRPRHWRRSSRSRSPAASSNSPAHRRTDGGYALDRHWRNVRVHSLHDPARWKYVHLGNHTLLGTSPPRLGVAPLDRRSPKEFDR